MDEPLLLPFDNGPVPEELWSDYLEAPFEACTACGGPLAEGLYEIQKVSNQRETILEMALCLRCGQSLATEYSTQSMEAIRSFLAEHLDLSRAVGLCSICGSPVVQAPTSSVWALCSQQRLVLPTIHVCSSCEEAIQELMSQKTRGAHDEFLNRTFPGVPADLDLAPKIVL